MIGSAIKKFARENGLTVKGGVAYGAYRGIHLTLQDGMGWKTASVAAYFETEEQMERIRDWLADESRQEDYRISGCSVTDLSVKPGAIRIAFVDNPGTMKKIEEFLPRLAEMLLSQNVKSVGVCHGCGTSDGGTSEVLLGGNVYRLHPTCASHVEEALAEEESERKHTGSVASGALGAAIGALVGIIPWVVVYLLGVVASFLGFVIGIAAKKGYELAKGKETRAKAVIILVAVLLAVVVAELVAIVAVNLGPGLEEGFTFGEVVTIMLQWAVYEEPLAVLKEIAIGWVFALLGIWKLLGDTFRQTKGSVVKKL